MKVLITTDCYRPTINGVVTAVVSLANGLAALGADVRILTLSGDRHSCKVGNVTYLGSIDLDKICPNARLKTAPSCKYKHELVEWHPDIVHSQSEFSTFILAKKIAKQCGCPLVHTYQTVYEDYTHYFSPSIRFGKYMAAAFSRSILAKTDAVIVPTGKVKTMLARYGVKTSVSVIPSGLELGQFAAQMPEDERNTMRESFGLTKNNMVLVYLGRLAQEKNIDELLKLMTLETDSRLCLLLVGDGPYRAQLEDQIKELNLSERVIFTGMVESNEVARYYALGDVFVCASQSETQGLTYIEAMASGMPLLCRNDPCLSEVIRDGVNGFIYCTAEEYHIKLHWLLNDDGVRRQMGSKAKQMAFQLFSSKGFAENVLSEYETLLPVTGVDNTSKHTTRCE